MPSRLALDHIVIRVNDLDKAIADYKSLGFTVVPGGEHPGRGSRNALIAFADDTYLELIGFSARPAPKPKKDRAKELAAEGKPPLDCRFGTWESAAEGVIDFALVPSDIEEVLKRAREAGLKMEGPIPGSRLRPDGQKVAWNLGIPDDFAVPFLCADVTPRTLRVPGGDARKHANGVVGIGNVSVSVADLAATSERYRKLLNVEPVKDFVWREDVGSGMGFLVETIAIILTQPSAKGYQADPGPTCLWLRGAGKVATSFDLQRSHGALISLL